MTAASPSALTVWRAARGPVVIALVIVTVAVAIALLTRGGAGGALHPEDVSPTGSRALARILAAQGVRIELVETTADAVRSIRGDGTATLLVTRPGQLRQSQLDALARARPAELVLVAAAAQPVSQLAPSVRVSGRIGVEERAPDCQLAAAAGTADLGGITYVTSDPAYHCYDNTLVRVASGPHAVTLLGDGAVLDNRHLDEDGNAALALSLLGRHERLIWYVPSLGDGVPADEQRSLTELLPAGWKYGAAQLAVAVVLLALWRARRLGTVVVEPLPVAVRGAETVEGLARLYRRAGARDRAAAALREAARSRISALLGDPGGGLAEAVASRTGREIDEVARLLDGAQGPVDDTALVRLADELDAVEREVRRT